MQSFTHGMTLILLKSYVYTLICLYTHKYKKNIQHSKSIVSGW